MVGNPFSDMIVRIKNGYLAGKKTVAVSHSKVKKELADIFLKAGYLNKVEITKQNSSAKKKAIGLKFLNLELKYNGKEPSLEGVKIVSKPGMRIYLKKGKIPQVLAGRGLVILSTPKGLMIGGEARKKNLGGEIICKIW